MTSPARPAAGAPGLQRWRWSVTAAFGLGGIAVSAWGPRLPAIKATLGVGTAAIGLLLAAVTVGAIGGLLAATPLLHRLGSRRAITAALGVITAAMVLMGAAVLAASVPLIAVAFAVAGLGIGTLDVLINVDGSAVERAAGRTLMPMMHAAWSIGVAVGAGIGAGCAALGITPSAQLIGEAVLIAAAALAVASGIPAGNHAAAGAGAGGAQASRGERLRQWLRGWLDWRLLLIGVVMLGAELGEGASNNWLTLAVRDDRGQSAAVAALFFATFAIGEASSRLLGGPLVDRFGRVAVVRATVGLGIAGVAAFIVLKNPWADLAGVLAWAAGVSMGFPLGMSAAAESGPDPAARVSVVASIGYFANLAGPPVIGLLAAAAGLLNSLWVIAVLFVAAFAAAGSFRPRAAARQEAAAATG